MGTLALAQRGRHTIYFSLVDTTQGFSLDVSFPWKVFAALVGFEEGLGGLNVALFRVVVMEYHSYR